MYKLNTIGCSYVASGSIAQVNTKDGSESLSGIMTCTYQIESKWLPAVDVMRKRQTGRHSGYNKTESKWKHEASTLWGLVGHERIYRVDKKYQDGVLYDGGEKREVLGMICSFFESYPREIMTPPCRLQIMTK